AARGGAAAAGSRQGHDRRAAWQSAWRPWRVAAAVGRLRPGDDRGRRRDLRLSAGGVMTRLLGIVALVAVVAATVFALFVVPAGANQGDAQRIMYVHVPSAWLAYLSFGVTALAGIGYLWRRDLRFDAVALAGAEVGVMFTAFAIWGGMMWGRPVWGVFWQWEDPRLTTTALLLALYVGFLLLRRLTDDPARRAARAAVVGLIAAVDIPIVHFSVIWWRGLHQ